MSLYKRKEIWWIDIGHRGKRIQNSTRTSDKTEAKRFHDEVKVNLWKTSYLNEKPNYTWPDAVLRWLEESQSKKSIHDDKAHLRWLDPYLVNKHLSEIDRDLIDDIAKAKEKTVTPATVNRMLASHKIHFT